MTGKVHIRLKVLLVCMVVLLAGAAFVVAGPASSAQAVTNCGDVMVSGSDWAGGNGVDAHYNAGSQGTANSCAGSAAIFNLGANPPRWGLGWQCVELAARLYKTRGWSNGLPGVNYAAEIYTMAAGLGMTAMAQGSIEISQIKPGDMIVSDQATYGHVSLVDNVSGNDVIAVEQNASSDGRAVYTYTPATKTLSRGAYYHISGVVHDPDNTLAGGSSGGSTGSDGFYHGTPPNGMIIESEDAAHWYVAFGGSLIWFDRNVAWLREALLDERDRLLHWMNAPKMRYADIHALEYGYGGDRSHVPADNSFFYEAGSAQQYVIQYRYAFSIGSVDEVSYLGGVNKAVMVPPGLASRLAGTPDIPNDVLLKSLPNPAYYHQVNGTAFWADNFTVIDCVRTVKGGGIQPVPDSLLGELWSAGRLSNQKTSCSFPPNWALYGPGGAERWWIDGANPYTRHHYSSSLALHCRLGSNPIEVQLPDTAGINQPTEAEPLGCPNNTYVRIAGNGEVFQVVDGWLHYVTSPASLSCLTAGHPEVVINIDGAVVATTPRGSNAYCTFEGKQLQAPSGQVDYVKDGARRHVLNWAIVNCLKGRSGTGDPIVVDQATFNGYTDSGTTAYCPYDTESGLNFVQEQGSPIVWLVGPAAGGPGVKRHAGSLCVNDPYTTPIKAAHVFMVPAGETAGHVQGADWWPSSADCQGLPQG